MKISTLVLNAALIAVAQSWSHEWNSDYDSIWTGQDAQKIIDESCKVSHTTAFEMSKTKDPIFFSTNGQNHPISPKLVPLNGTGGEQWEIDGISSDGMQSFMFGFYRDPNYAILGSGNLRINIEMAFSNGTRFVQVDYASDSIIEECEWGTRGTWKSDSFNYVFQVTRDMSKMKVALDSKLLKGIVHLNSITKPRFPDGKLWPSEYSTSEALPYFHFVEHIPVGNIEVDLVVEGEKWVWAGIGGSIRLWGAFSWFTCLQGMHIIRAVAGPYALTLWDFRSNIKKGKQYSSVILFQDGEKIFGTQNMEESDSKDYFTWQKNYEGIGVIGTLKDKPTGFELELISLQRKKHITFSIEHKNVAFEYILGGGHGASGFTSDVTAGQVGLEWFRGVAMTETLNFPPKSPLFKVQYSE